jgi:predicted RNase H-like HicB family nuclease
LRSARFIYRAVITFAFPVKFALCANMKDRTIMQKILFIPAEWDEEANVWVATSDDVPGLATEADTLEALSTKLESMVPELLNANGKVDLQEIPFELLARKFTMTHRAVVR